MDALPSLNFVVIHTLPIPLSTDTPSSSTATPPVFDRILYLIPPVDSQYRPSILFHL